MIYEFNGMRPYIHESAFVHPQACVTGCVRIGRDVYIGPGAAIRGDWGEIIIEDGCNVQENCVLHTFPGVSMRLSESAHIGHGAVVHGAQIGRNVLIGMNAVIMDEAVIGEGSIVGALAFVPTAMQIPPRSLVVGNPAKIIREVSQEMLDWKTAGTQLYQQLPAQLHTTLRPCEPLRIPPTQAHPQLAVYRNWRQTQNNPLKEKKAD